MPKGIYARTKQHKKAMSIAHIGIKFSEDHKENLSISHKGKYDGSKNPNWKSGITMDGSGYMRRYSPDHPSRNNKGYVFDHRLVMEQHLGRRLDPEEVVHHINGDTSDNRIENLMLFPNNSKHRKFHCGVADGSN